MVKYIVEGYKWFDKVNGNTYHSTCITDAKTNKLLFCSGIAYGYGDSWKDTAMNWLIETKRWKKKDRFNYSKIRKEIYFGNLSTVKKRDLPKRFVSDNHLKVVKVSGYRSIRGR